MGCLWTASGSCRVSLCEPPALAVRAAPSCTPLQPNTDILWCWAKAPARPVGRET